jgi:nitrite reductase/ring-hydroxylating ferredoxin subunit
VREHPRRLVLGPPEDVRARAPFCVELGGRSYRIVELGGELVAHAAVCPHWLGPLRGAPVEDGCVRCPWHGYRFDLRTGRSADGRGLRLPPAPRVEIDRMRVVLSER